MSNRLVTLIIINLLIFNIGIVGILIKNNQRKSEGPSAIVAPVRPESTPTEMKIDINYDIDDPVPAYKNYEQTWQQLQDWSKQCPEITEVGDYGRSSRGETLHYIKINNPDVHTAAPKPVVMITACIHGNEPLSASTVMGYIGTILEKYGEDEELTKLIDKRIIYFIPVVSPDSYPVSRHVDGVDPNRDFPTQRNPNKISVPPVRALQLFTLKIKPNAVISGHTYGRVYLTPWGDQTRRSSNNSDFNRIVGEMGRLSQYRVQRACEMYNRPIYGTEVDWYYRQEAFAIVMEFGTHQRIPTHQEIKSEFDRTFEAVLHFIKEAPIVEIDVLYTTKWKKAA